MDVVSTAMDQRVLQSTENKLPCSGTAGLVIISETDN